MARKIITSIREQYDRWFRENVNPKIPTVEEVAAARALMVEYQKKFEILKGRYDSYQMGLKLMEKLPSTYLLPKDPPPERMTPSEIP